MWIDPELRRLVQLGRFDEIEERWMACLETAPDDVDFFAGVLQLMHQEGANDRTTLLVELLQQAHRDRGNHRAALEVCKGCLRAVPDSPLLRRALLETLRQAYADRPNYQTITDHLGLTPDRDLLAILDEAETWLEHDVGRVVFLRGRGTGRVREIHLRLGVVRVDFAGGNRESFRLAEAKKLLTVLEPDSFLFEKREHPDRLRALAQSDPSALLERVFADPQAPAKLGELREHLEGLVLQSEWDAWWKKARKDRRLILGRGVNAKLGWTVSGEAADEDCRTRFETASWAERLVIARREAGRSADLARFLGSRVLGGARALRATEPDRALEAYLTLTTGLDTGDIDPVPEAVSLLRDGETARLVDALPERVLREQALDLVHQHVPDWERCFATLLPGETQARTIALLYRALLDKKPDTLAPVVETTLAKPETAPHFFVWLCKNMKKRPELKRRANLGILYKLLEAVSNPSFRGLRAPVRAEFEAGGLVDSIVKGLDVEDARLLLDVLQSPGRLDEARNEDLRRLVLRFHPDLRTTDIDFLYSTPEALDQKRSELEQFVRVDIPRNAEEIRTAAAHGDLSENHEYKAARERHEFLSSRAKALHDELTRARALEPGSIDPSRVRPGTRMTLVPQDGGPSKILTILGPWDSDPAQGIVSYMAPAVQDLLGKKPGDQVTFSGQRFQIEAIEVWRDD